MADGSLVTTAPAYITETLVVTDSAGHPMTVTEVIQNPTLAAGGNGDPGSSSKFVPILLFLMNQTDCVIGSSNIPEPLLVSSPLSDLP
jgi:hypothetical protein